MATQLQYSCLENPMDGRTWWATVRGVAKSRTWLSDFTFTFWTWRRLIMERNSRVPVLSLGRWKQKSDRLLTLTHKPEPGPWGGPREPWEGSSTGRCCSVPGMISLWSSFRSNHRPHTCSLPASLRWLHQGAHELVQNEANRKVLFEALLGRDEPWRRIWPCLLLQKPGRPGSPRGLAGGSRWWGSHGPF